MSPKFHDHDVGPLLDRSVKLTVNGNGPAVGEPEKSATGGPPGQDTVMPTTENADWTSEQLYPRSIAASTAPSAPC